MKLLKLYIVFLSSVLVYCNSPPSKVSQTTTTLRPFSSILSRQKRTLLLPNNGSIKLTITLGKAIIGNSPKGLVLCWELSSYIDGPTKLKDLFRRMPHWPKDNSKQETNATDYLKEQKMFSSTNIHKNLLHAVQIVQEVSSGLHRNILVGKGTNWYDKINSHHQVFKRSNDKYENIQSKLIEGYGQSKVKSPLEKLVASLLGMDVRCAILKSICRRKDFLLPPGYSMIQDIVRVVFQTIQDESSNEQDLSVCDKVSDCGHSYQDEDVGVMD